MYEEMLGRYTVVGKTLKRNLSSKYGERLNTYELFHRFIFFFSGKMLVAHKYMKNYYSIFFLGKKNKSNIIKII